MKFAALLLISVALLGMVLASGCLGNSTPAPQGGNNNQPAQSPANGQPNNPSANSGTGSIPQPPALPE
ncbi:MAG: hypothetical protein HY544_04390 [Candidatus Diapherotrites archaeon]|uniref:Uncharacterized protein n=1 Tax=Candidatus Iainarchaeum sp. TaxID=3101447 RepID=A0A8T3YKZ4_9ARCH|nr:hypothetical protein [Candidatus Diapherotrites archaeon]